MHEKAINPKPSADPPLPQNDCSTMISKVSTNDSRRHSPAALRDGLVDGFVHLFVVVVLITSVFPHVGLEGRRMTAHVSAEGAPEQKDERTNKNQFSSSHRFHLHTGLHTVAH